MAIKPESVRNQAAARGHARDKVSFPDPATVPLQADAEAGGQATPDLASAPPQKTQNDPSLKEIPDATHSLAGRGQHQIPARSHAWLFGGLLITMALLGLGSAYFTLP